MTNMYAKNSKETDIQIFQLGKEFLYSKGIDENTILKHFEYTKCAENLNDIYKSIAFAA